MNVKPLTQLIVLMSGMVALVAVGIAGMVAIEWLRPDGHNTQLNTEIVGVVTLAALQILGFIRSVLNGKQIEKKSEEIKQEIQAAPVMAAEGVRREANKAKAELQYEAVVAAKKLTDTASKIAEKGN